MNVRPYLAYTVFERLRDPGFFALAQADHGTVSWPGGIDLDPDSIFLESVPIPQDAKILDRVPEHWHVKISGRQSVPRRHIALPGWHDTEADMSRNLVDHPRHVYYEAPPFFRQGGKRPVTANAGVG